MMIEKGEAYYRSHSLGQEKFSFEGVHVEARGNEVEQVDEYVLGVKGPEGKHLAFRMTEEQLQHLGRAICNVLDGQASAGFDEKGYYPDYVDGVLEREEEVHGVTPLGLLFKRAIEARR